MCRVKGGDYNANRILKGRLKASVHFSDGLFPPRGAEAGFTVKWH